MSPLYAHALTGLKLELARAEHELATYADGGDAVHALASLECYSRMLAKAARSEAARLEEGVSVHD